MPLPIISVISYQLRKIVGWVEQSEAQQRVDNLGFRPSTQPTPMNLLLRIPQIWGTLNYLFPF